MGNMLSISGLVKRYGARTILDGLSLTVEPGATVAIVGESGAGKSTLLNLIAGLEQPDAGCIEVAGADLTFPGITRAASPPTRATAEAMTNPRA